MGWWVGWLVGWYLDGFVERSKGPLKALLLYLREKKCISNRWMDRMGGWMGGLFVILVLLAILSFASFELPRWVGISLGLR